MSDNPHASPQFAGVEPAPADHAGPLRLASQNQRFLNLVIDWIAVQVVASGVGFVFGLLYATSVLSTEGGSAEPAEPTLDLVSHLIGVLIYLGYYFVLEAGFGRTVGKLITGTKVVNKRGGPASLGQILGRSFCRLIPFEAFSFFGKEVVGWHDSIPETRVIRTR